nr:MAG TPA: hypothetical protein [Caudoviricetes sp.]
MRLLRWLNVYPSVCRGIPPRRVLNYLKILFSCLTAVL